MSSVGFCAKTQQTIFGIISAVLLLGNITYIKVGSKSAPANSSFCRDMVTTAMKVVTSRTKKSWTS